MAGFDSSQTTLTTPGGPPRAEQDRPLSLMWLFPRPTDPVLCLDFAPGEERIIGRDAGCALPLAGADTSRRHARLYREGPAFFLADLGSHNGTFVNGRRIDSVRLAVGDIVRFGGFVALITDCPGVPTEIAPGLLAGPLLERELGPVRRAATSDLPVILEGETGTGKEVVARAIHGWSGRAGPFVAVNCAALPEALAEGELFGYRRGAFTGAERPSPGFFRSAHGGTLLLDEASDLPLGIQAKLLRVLEQREVQPLGEAEPVAVDTRIIIASQEPLTNAVKKRRFRQDLLARLEGITVHLPPLRKRRGDVPALFSRIFSEPDTGRGPAFEADFVEHLCLYDWPFNVREVVLLARRLRVISDDNASLRARDLPARMTESSQLGDPAHERSESEPADLPALVVALRAAQGNVAQAAAVLGISRQRAYRLMQGQSVNLDALRAGDEGDSDVDRAR
jgi:Sigma-54 interaction domain/FHA domain/Bacterial regulatory protein, Fis family